VDIAVRFLVGSRSLPCFADKFWWTAIWAIILSVVTVLLDMAVGSIVRREPSSAEPTQRLNRPRVSRVGSMPTARAAIFSG
jgi:hypothetical protein